MTVFGFPLDAPTVAAGSAAIGAIGAWMLTLMRESHIRRKDIIDEYSALMEKMQTRETLLINRISSLEAHISTLQEEIMTLNVRLTKLAAKAQKD